MTALRTHTSPLAHRLRWPWPALMVWLACTAAFRLAVREGVPPLWAAVLLTLLGGIVALRASTPWRRGLTAAGFPASLLASGLLDAQGTFLWLLPLGVLLVAYPVRSWSDAPLFPTPAKALSGLPGMLDLPPGARVLDAGCGLGHGLRAWRRLYPQARLEGVEWSPLWSLCARGLCYWADIRQGDMWRIDWSDRDVVYVFQRPESMPRVWDKACREMKPGSTLVSLAFEVPDVSPDAFLETVPGRAVHVYRMQGWRHRELKSATSGTDMQNTKPSASRPGPRPRQAGTQDRTHIPCS